MWQTFYRPSSLATALTLLENHPHARLVAGGTDLIVELRRGFRPTETLIDLSGISDLRYIELDQDRFRIGALATHNDVLGSDDRLRMLPLAQASREVGAPQIRAAATIVGNLVTASPANDTITALMALDAELAIVSTQGERIVPLHAFYQGVRRTILQPGELVREVRFTALRDDQQGLFLKLGLRRAQAISVVNAAIIIERDQGVVQSARITLGCVAPTIIHASAAEQYLVGRTLDPEVCSEAGRLAEQAAQPIDDLRGSAHYRRQAVAALVRQGLTTIANGQAAQGWDAPQVRLEIPAPAAHTSDQPVTTISAMINGQPEQIHNASNQTLLDALRMHGLTGTKEGCAEGECGACTIWLNGRAVMSCLTPAAQAHGATITTIEGLAHGDQLHPLQQQFLNHGAVQCGFCTPGILMAAARLLDEHPNPSDAQIQTAISGNLCRCTGYQQIIQAVRDAASQSEATEARI
jgi:carbon-monoxide dehydrogenase medium subunit